ncbi:RagB/SusD family nutrient uptake outer membrane protein [Niabella hirudinis]|uniref:RagB/SusD family nutrient uptake outer membrane protein n=1 Tax=Niabella hirudinis TaxID=1285929 RepID=UPI003EB70FC6
MKVIYISFFVLLAAGLGGCKKFLNTKPTDVLTGEEYYNTELKLTNALAGVYDKLGANNLYGDYMFSEWEACTDDSYYARSATVTGVALYNFDFTNSRIVGLWQDCYIGIERANQLIANINIPQMDEGKRAIILGEAKFLRAYYYFLLVTRFGGVPLLLQPTTSPNNLDIARTPAAEVYAQILKDMKDAEAVLPSSSALGYSSRVSKTVAEGLLARVCLHMAGFPLNDQSKYTEALSWAKKVKESGEHALNTAFNSALTNSAYSQIFINHSQDIYDVKESMWEVDFKGSNGDGTNEGGRVGNTIGITMTSVPFQADTGYSYGFIKGTGRLFKLYGNGDQRRDWTLQTYTYNGTTGARVPIVTNASNMYSRDAGKWRRSYELLRPKNKNYGPTNFPLLRYADVLLMLAEAENQVNGPTDAAYEAINQVRRRAYGVDIAAASAIADAPAGLSKDLFQLFIEDERSRELCFETLRRQDLVRWGKFVPAMKAVSADMAANGGGVKYGALGGSNVSERNLLYPIPSGEMALNKKMVQNPGW